jgi:molecular chaperone GrpE
MSTDDEQQPDQARAPSTGASTVREVEGQGGSSSESAVADPVDEARAETQRVRDQLLRTAADYDNYRKRTRRETDEAQKRGREELIRELLPVFDNLERAVVHAGQASDAKAVADGVGMVLKQFVDTLARVGITRLKVVGTPFDPTQHEAIQQVETDEHPAGTVIAEVQPGYLLGERLLRAAMVVVAKPGLKNGDTKPDPN